MPIDSDFYLTQLGRYRWRIEPTAHLRSQGWPTIDLDADSSREALEKYKRKHTPKP